MEHLMTEDEAILAIGQFLTRKMRDAFRTVSYDIPPLEAEGDREHDIADLARARIGVSYVRGAANALYRIEAFDDVAMVHVQLNVWRFVVIYRTPVSEGMDSSALMPRLERWQKGAEHAGWVVGWRDTNDSSGPAVETYCYANTTRTLLEDELELMFWRTDIVQMTRAFILEAHRCGIRLAAPN